MRRSVSSPPLKLLAQMPLVLQLVSCIKPLIFHLADDHPPHTLHPAITLCQMSTKIYIHLYLAQQYPRTTKTETMVRAKGVTRKGITVSMMGARVDILEYRMKNMSCMVSMHQEARSVLLFAITP